MIFNPNNCRNESEVESKLIVSYLLPKLGYTPDTWHQEIAFGNIRLDFLSFATQSIPIVIDADSPMSVIMEAKHPKENLDRHLRKFTRYLTNLSVRYGLITNGKEIRIYTRVADGIQLVFQCAGQEVEAKFDEINALIGRDNLKSIKNPEHLELKDSKINSIEPESIGELPIQQNNSATAEPEPIPETHPVNLQNTSDRTSPKSNQNTMKIIAVYHNKGGVGKTTTVVNLAAALSKKGHRILVIDLDSQANTTFATGLVKFEDEELDDLKDSNILQVLQSEDFYSIDEVARQSNFSNPEIDVVPSHIDLMQYETELNQLDYSRMILIQKLAEVRDKYDIVLIDTPPSLNFYARVALIAADYLIIPSDLKPFANQGLINVKDFIKKVNGFKKQIGKKPLEVLGVLACKISTNAKFVQHSLPKRRAAIPKRYDMEIMDSVIYERFAYYAAVRAREIEPLKGETIGAFILEPENEELLLEQVKILRNSRKKEQTNQSDIPQNSSSLEQRLTNIETRLENRINELKTESLREKQALVERVKELESRIPKPVPLLEALNTQDKFKLATNLKNAGLKPQIIEKILKERDLEPFASFENLLERIKGLGEKTAIKLIDKWQKY